MCDPVGARGEGARPGCCSRGRRLRLHRAVGFGALRLQSPRVAGVRSRRHGHSARVWRAVRTWHGGSEAGPGHLDFTSWTVSERVTPSMRPVAWVCQKWADQVGKCTWPAVSLAGHEKRRKWRRWGPGRGGVRTAGVGPWDRRGSGENRPRRDLLCLLMTCFCCRLPGKPCCRFCPER